MHSLLRLRLHLRLRQLRQWVWLRRCSQREPSRGRHRWKQRQAQERRPRQAGWHPLHYYLGKGKPWTRDVEVVLRLARDNSLCLL